ncbi:MAG: tetratricopeptide repeat protein [Nannocystales bacterium]
MSEASENATERPPGRLFRAPVTGEDNEECGQRLDALLSEAPTSGPEGARVLTQLRHRLFGIEAAASVGRYTELHAVGRGGIGAVYRAWDPVLKRHVALKFLRLSGARERRCLVQEARTAARLNHPNIAQVFDVGEHGGEAFIAMEFVDGQDLDAWLTLEPRSVAEILGVLCLAGRGLAAAHAAGVAHLDFKPRNVLVGRDGTVRVADFGLARSVEVHRGASAWTGGTPRYSAPHVPAELQVLEDARRTDQYAFAVTAWESLCRQAGHRLPRTPTSEPLPGGVGVEVAQALKVALAPDPAHRFDSVDALLDAMESSERRTSVGLIFVASVGVALVGLMFALFGGNPEPRQGRAETLRVSPDPEVVLRGPRELLRSGELDRAAARFEAIYLESAQAADPPLALRSAVAMADISSRRAEPRQTDRWVGHARTWEARVPAGSTALVDLELLEAHRARKRGHLVEARALADRAWDRCGADLRHPAAVAALVEVGQVAVEQARLGDAARAFEDGLRAAEHVTDERRGVRASVLLGLGNALWALDDLAGAAKAYEESLESWTRLYGREHVRSATAVMNLGLTHRARGRFDEARTLLKEAAEILERVAGPDSPDTALAFINLGTVESDMGDWHASASHHRRAAVIFEAAWGADHPRVALALGNLGAALADAGELEKAVEAYESSLEILRATHGTDHPSVATNLHNLAVAYRRSGDSRAELVDREALRMFEDAGGAHHRNILGAVLGLAFDAGARHAWKESEALAMRALDLEPADPLLRALAQIRVGRARVELSVSSGERELEQAEILLDALGPRGDGARAELARARAGRSPYRGRSK